MKIKLANFIKTKENRLLSRRKKLKEKYTFTREYVYKRSIRIRGTNQYFQFLYFIYKIDVLLSSTITVETYTYVKYIYLTLNYNKEE